MQHPTDPHEPSPDFHRFLEWQTRTTLRRGERFGGHAHPRGPRWSSGLPRVARLAALVLVSLFAGAGAVVAAERLQDSRVLAVLLEDNRLRLELAERRVQSAREAEASARLRVEQGLAPGVSVLGFQLRLAQSERDLTLQVTDREELAAAGRTVDERLSAPLVHGRDFVRERLETHLTFHERALELFRKEAAIRKAQVESGNLPASVLFEVEDEAAALRSELERTVERLALRGDFVAGRVEAEACERRDRIAGAEHRLRHLDVRQAALERDLEHQRVLQANGLSSGEVGPLELARDELRVERELVLLELELLR